MEQVHKKLAAIQAALKAPKSQFNKFGGYKYRKAEDILEAVKPLLKEYGCTLTCTDELQLIGDRYYIKATATITNSEDGVSVSTTAYAREEEEKKGMDGSQVTGASSSYARKYALNGLLCIDNTPDSDATNTTVREDNGTKKVSRKAAAQAEATATKKALPARHSEEWDKWVAAIVSGWKSKQGKTAIQVFTATYEASEATMQDVHAALEEDAFDLRMSTGQPANQEQAHV